MAVRDPATPEPRAMQVVRLVAIGAVVGFLGTFVGARLRAVDRAAHERYVIALARLATLEHLLAEHLMRARTGLLPNYDPLVVTVADLREVHERLRSIPSHIAGDGRVELEAAVASSSSQFEEEAALVERFKTENAVFLNSLRYVPLAAAHTARSGDPALTARTDAIVRDLLLLHQWSDDLRSAGSLVSADAIRARLDALSGVPDVPEVELGILRAHVEVLLVRQPRISELLSQVFALQRARIDARLDRVYLRHHAAAERRGGIDEVVLFVLALVFVVSLAAYIILRLRRSAGELHRTTLDLAAAIDLKNRFVSMSSHEFRTPLAVILSSLELLEAYAERWTPEKKQDHYRRIRGAVVNMTQLIDGMLLIGRSDAGVRDFKPGPFDLDRVCREVIGQVELKTGGRRTISYAPPQKPEIVADERLFRHVLDNLLTNAVKYSPDGGKTELEAVSDGLEVTLAVSDEGIGIPEADRARLFESFARASNVGTIQGTGLGLAIVKRAVDLHGGRVTVKSEVGRGTRFEVRLPVGGSRTSSKVEEATV